MRRQAPLEMLLWMQFDNSHDTYRFADVLGIHSMWLLEELGGARRQHRNFAINKRSCPQRT